VSATFMGMDVGNGKSFIFFSYCHTNGTITVVPPPVRERRLYVVPKPPREKVTVGHDDVTGFYLRTRAR
jgi:hypothetical protein